MSQKRILYAEGDYSMGGGRYLDKLLYKLVYDCNSKNIP